MDCPYSLTARQVDRPFGLGTDRWTGQTGGQTFWPFRTGHTIIGQTSWPTNRPMQADKWTDLFCVSFLRAHRRIAKRPSASERRQKDRPPGLDDRWTSQTNGQTFSAFLDLFCVPCVRAHRRISKRPSASERRQKVRPPG